ncbi:sulfatase [Stieleria varia]|uniref:Choline-sulfatase n=1 Tax=Stieleria varia TaxID=2528005 RepID=A0A5C5ZWM7_9BACT|nr:sulfatase [Stieleria varia]TWT91525.1 Choline-sulfatase [Stieleria varia]
MLFSRFCLAAAMLALHVTFVHSAETETASRPNVLMICIDDLNDWVEPLGGHPQAKTPAMKRLAERGVNFRNAHCQSPLCNPSRTSLMTSRRPSSTGIYGLKPWFRDLPELQKVVSLPQHFSNAGYRTLTAGKVYHNSLGRKPPAGAEPEFDEWGPRGGPGIMPKEKLVPETPAGNLRLVDWGVFPHEDNQKGDYIVASWAEQAIADLPDDGKPFFLSVGFFLPHVPCIVTQKWWDMYPDESLVMPVMKPNDRDDCSPFSWFLHWNLPEPRLTWLEHHQQHRSLVRSYLASISFVDAQVGRVLDALESSPFKDNTIIVLWSDHGWHLGEKEMTGKNTLWEPSTRVPLIFAGPGIQPGTCDEPAELLDVYPTLADLAGLNAPADIDGISLTPQIADVTTPRSRPAITEHNPGNMGIRDRRFRFIRYADGSEELYDVERDPNEFNNVIADPQYTEAAERLRKFVIADPEPLAPDSAARVLDKRSDGWYWEGKRIDTENPPMYSGQFSKGQFSKAGAAGGPQ